MNNSVASKKFARSPSMIQWAVIICEDVDRFFPKIVPILLKNFLDFKFDTVEMQSIINLNNKSYVSVVVNDSEVPPLLEKRMQLFVYFIFHL